MEPFAIVTRETPSLRERSQEVDPKEITTPAFQAYLDRLSVTMLVKDGVGIASPQAGRNIRVIVVLIDDMPTCFINPVITKASEAKVQDEEGCLSVPGIYGLVERHKRIKIEALNRHGRRITVDARHFLAIVLQHEIDHLDGILFIDKMIKQTGTGGKHI
ncbi:peptide deformylase [Patescibacteria group bacterium]|nr:peptide deformylase [Patescibacteria group bacterium]